MNKQLMGANILDIETSFYKGCINEQGESIEMYRTNEHYLVCVDNIVVHVSNGRKNALAKYNSYFD